VFPNRASPLCVRMIFVHYLKLTYDSKPLFLPDSSPSPTPANTTRAEDQCMANHGLGLDEKIDRPVAADTPSHLSKDELEALLLKEREDIRKRAA